MDQETKDPETPEIPAENSESSMRKNIRWLCVFTLMFTGYLFFTKPITTTASLIFRLALVILALGGLLALYISGKRGK